VTLGGGVNLNTEEEIRIDCSLSATMMVEEERKKKKLCDEIPVEVGLKVYVFWWVRRVVWCSICRMIYHM